MGSLRNRCSIIEEVIHIYNKDNESDDDNDHDDEVNDANLTSLENSSPKHTTRNKKKKNSGQLPAAKRAQIISFKIVAQHPGPSSGRNWHMMAKH